MPDRIKTSTIVDELISRMRDMLYAGEFQAGERLVLKDLQARFGVSHIPIREALRTLEAEGLVENLPQRGAVAAPVSITALEEVYDARRLLEPALAARAASMLNDDDIAELAEAYRRLEDSTADDREFFEAHRMFHWLTMKPGATPTLERMLRQLWGQAERFLRLSMAFPSDVAPALDQHRQIFELASSGNPDVGEIVTAHLHVTEDAIKAHYRAGRGEDG